MSSADTIFNYIFGYFVKMYYLFSIIIPKGIGKNKKLRLFSKKLFIVQNKIL